MKLDNDAVVHDTLPTIDDQIALETETFREGVTSYRLMVQEAKNSGRESETTAGHRLLRTAITPMIKAIEDDVDRMLNSRGGPKRIAMKAIMHLDSDIVAYITAKTIINSLHRMDTYTKVALEIGAFIEDELSLRRFESESPYLYRAIHKRITSKSQNYQYQKNVLSQAMSKYNIPKNGFAPSDKLQIGIKLIDLFEKSTGMIEVSTKWDNQNKTSIKYVSAVQATSDWIKQENSHCELLRPHYLPMIVEPRPWVSMFAGGYLTSDMSRTIKLIKASNKNYCEEVNNCDIPEVYKSVNYIQSVKWQINIKVLTVIKQIWDSQIASTVLPPANDLNKPPCPLPSNLTKETMTQEQLEQFAIWKRKVAALYDKDRENRGKRVRLLGLLHIANKFKDYSAIYFPHNLDFRGRVYSIPALLNPQGCDTAKGLLQFTEGKAMTEAEHVDWFYINGANLYGYDKVDFSDRIDWCVEHMEDIVSSALDPLSNSSFWTKADKPFQFLAWCFECKELEDTGFGFITHIPVYLDGSCNGLQHFSAMLRDPVCGAQVNLIPSDTPADIYQTVADVSSRLLMEDPGESPEIAQAWVDFGITRKLTKRPVMVLPYGGTFTACCRYIEEYLDEILTHDSYEIRDAVPYILAKDPKKSCMYLSGYVWKAIGEVVIGPREAMRYLQKVAAMAAKNNLPINWTTPVGLPIQQAYKETESRRVVTKLYGSTTVLQTYLQQATGKLDRRKQVQGISPNFVHSLDAACLQRYVIKLNETYVIGNVALVHDAYGTLAPDTANSAKCLREVFVEMYQSNDVLEQFVDNILPVLSKTQLEQLPPKPEKGSLNLGGIKDSKFFFA